MKEFLNRFSENMILYCEKISEKFEETKNFIIKIDNQYLREIVRLKLQKFSKIKNNEPFKIMQK